MIDHSKWKQSTKSVTSLLLDSRNPRLLPRTTVPSQVELIAELVKHENVYELAKGITERGFFRVELPIAVEEGGKLVVVEGNRRLAALKLLISPNLAPESERAKFKKLSNKTVISQIKKILVTIAPSRDAAAPVILSKHTRKEVEGWSPVMQARFYADRVADGSTVAELSKEYAITPGQIMEFLQNYQMYQVACSLDLPADVAGKVNDPREFPLSTLERIYRSTEAAEFLGISFDAHRQLKGTIPLGEFKKAFRKIVSDVASGKVTSRNLNKTEEFKKYFDEFGASAPDKTYKGSFTVKDIIAQAPGKVQSMPKAIPQPPQKPLRLPTALIPKAFASEIPDPRINALIKDLKKISIDDHPNTVALALRGLLDLTVGDYCDRLGATAKIIERARTKENKPADWYPSVRQMLKYIVGESANFTIHPLALKAAKMLVADDTKTVTVLALDAFAHNKYVTPTSAELRSFWTQIEEAMKVMLAAPAPSTPAPDGGS